MSRRLRRSDLSAVVLPEEHVEVPELDGEVLVRGLGLQRRLEMAWQGADGRVRVADLLAETVLDADLVPLMDARDWDVWGAQHYDAALRLARVAMRLSGLGPDAEEDAAKNSAAGSTAGSASSSPAH